MIFLKLKIDNLYMFKGAEFDFTYPKKIRNSTIEGEFLTDFPKINYKKVCILMGANASGKTSLGKLMCSINNYLLGREVDGIPKTIYDKNKNASVEITYITQEAKNIHQLTINFNQESLVSEIYKSNKLKKTYNLEKTLSKLDDSSPKFLYNKENKHNIENPGFKSVAYSMGYELCKKDAIWNYKYSDFENSNKLDVQTHNINILESILKSFDNSISSVNAVTESEKNIDIVKFFNGDEVLIENGKILNPDRFSRGTIESIEITDFINFITAGAGGTFFLDEKMAYSHSEIEISILNLIIEKLKSNSQFFYTTHNYDVLEMNLPSHSYIFMKKDSFVEAIHPEKLGYTKNDRSLLGFVKNDVFGTLPNTDKIESLL
ncbi:hypothetical protein BHECKSOX_518 [Bathymodiolus heckerae thiotrophic gill symbiont]|uniref:ATP-binding protein n=1 Tax=Bathymodiolus heckerae thiotrophic gill symbiont TaxID=1052212 RepID=UPI0010B73F78|nr:ATP-binding protein [Bathymodiolus heckerae thiotrophic gill symbiont]SHN92331.1 hypothetical protein BHECKSOX_518 [Bathymodiolus heckerae thiotrophic gill symbiont]